MHAPPGDPESEAPPVLDLRARLLEIVGLELGGEVLPGVPLVEASTELGPTLTFEAGGELLQVHVEPRSPERPCAATTERLAFSYRSAGGRAPAQLGLALCRRLAELATPREARVLGALARDADRSQREEERVRVREVRVTRLLEPARERGRHYYTLSPYVGCTIGCRFCYAQSRVAVSRRLEGAPEVPWGGYVDLRVNAADVLRRELAERAPAPLKFCPIVSDPYQGVERRHGLTRACLEVVGAAREPWPVLILTRSTLVERDLELIASLPGAHVGVSIPTADDRVRAHFEPRGASIEERLRVLEAFRVRSVRTFAVVQPQLPGDVVALAAALAGRVESVSLDVLHGEEGAKRDFDHPEFTVAREAGWQAARREQLQAELERRGVVPWLGELPPWLG